MKLYVTIGTSNEQNVEHEFYLAEGENATYIGLEIDDPDHEGRRLTILRTPFVEHGTGIHSVCRKDDDEIMEVRV